MGWPRLGWGYGIGSTYVHDARQSSSAVERRRLSCWGWYGCGGLGGAPVGGVGLCGQGTAGQGQPGHSAAGSPREGNPGARWKAVAALRLASLQAPLLASFHCASTRFRTPLYILAPGPFLANP